MYFDSFYIVHFFDEKHINEIDFVKSMEKETVDFYGECQAWKITSSLFYHLCIKIFFAVSAWNFSVINDKLIDKFNEENKEQQSKQWDKWMKKSEKQKKEFLKKLLKT